MTNNIACHKREGVLVDCYVEADLSASFWEHEKYSLEEYAKGLEKKCEELVAFLRDHRSQDRVNLIVTRVRKDLCSSCGSEWETYSVIQDWDTHKGRFLHLCAHCGAEVGEENT